MMLYGERELLVWFCGLDAMVELFSYASMAWPQPDWLVPVADEVAALEVVVLVDWAAARLATARMRAVEYCMVLLVFGRMLRWRVCLYNNIA